MAPCNVTVDFSGGGGGGGVGDHLLNFPANGARYGTSDLASGGASAGASAGAREEAREGASAGKSKGTTPTHTRMARIDVDHANPMAAWIAMGSPTYPSPSQLAKLETASELVWEDVEHADQSSLTAVVPAHGLVIYDLALQ